MIVYFLTVLDQSKFIILRGLEGDGVASVYVSHDLLVQGDATRELKGALDAP